MRGALLLVVAVLLVGGCRDETPSIPVSALPRLVLAETDVPPGLEQFDVGRQGLADQPGGLRAEAARFGRLGGWKTRYRSRTPGGPLVVESRADVFDSNGGAEEELEAFEAEADAVEEVEIGDGGLLSTAEQAGVPRPVRVLVVAWKQDNVVGTITLNGFRGDVTRADVLALARRQSELIDAASTG